MFVYIHMHMHTHTHTHTYIYIYIYIYIYVHINSCNKGKEMNHYAVLLSVKMSFYQLAGEWRI